jgi:hypothetical protein
MLAPGAARRVGWLTPWTVLQRWWTAWSKAPPPPQLQALIDSVTAGHGLNLYLLGAVAYVAEVQRRQTVARTVA